MAGFYMLLIRSCFDSVGYNPQSTCLDIDNKQFCAAYSDDGVSPLEDADIDKCKAACLRHALCKWGISFKPGDCDLVTADCNGEIQPAGFYTLLSRSLHSYGRIELWPYTAMAV